MASIDEAEHSSAAVRINNLRRVVIARDSGGDAAELQHVLTQNCSKDDNSSTIGEMLMLNAVSLRCSMAAGYLTACPDAMEMT